jgi:hypothetical protein
MAAHDVSCSMKKPSIEEYKYSVIVALNIIMYLVIVKFTTEKMVPSLFFHFSFFVLASLMMFSSSISLFLSFFHSFFLHQFSSKHLNM